MPEPIIRCRDVTHAYARGRHTVSVLEQLNLSIDSGDFVALMGPSGSGKTTLLNLIGGLESPTSGSIKIQGLEITQLPANSLADWRAASVGFVFQFYHLLPVLSAIDNVGLPLLLTTLSRKERASRAAAALELVGLADRSAHKPVELSGGQQQRVAIARAIVADPQLLICDEPTGDLDRQAADEILMLLQTLNQELHKTIVMVTHDQLAATYASTVLHMDKGCLLEAAT
ncbi:MAG: ABC transporter ATP-binding protein [Pseudomonadota bacterium]